MMSDVFTMLAVQKPLHTLCSQHHLALQTGCGGGVELKEKIVTIIKLGRISKHLSCRKNQCI